MNFGDYQREIYGAGLRGVLPVVYPQFRTVSYQVNETEVALGRA